MMSTWAREKARELDVFRGCSDHVYPHDGCPHCVNNSAVVDKVVTWAVAALAEAVGQAQSISRGWDAEKEVWNAERDALKAKLAERDKVGDSTA